MSVDVFSNHPEGQVFLRDPAEFRGKVTDIVADGPSSLSALLDFDHTMSQGGPDDLSTWEAVDARLPLEGRDEAAQLYYEYYPLEKLGKLTVSQAVEWTDASLMLYVKYGINKADIKAAADSIHLRMGMAAVLKDLIKEEAPTNILSAGIGDVINHVAERDVRKKDLITVTATSLQYGEDGTVTGYCKEGMVHSLNKLERGSSWLEEVRKQRDHVLLVGDSEHDILAAQGGTGHTISVRVGDVRKIKSIRDFKDKSFAAGYDMVSIGKSMMPVRQLTRAFLHLSTLENPAE